VIGHCERSEAGHCDPELGTGNQKPETKNRITIKEKS